MDKHTNIHSDVTAVKVMLLKHAVRSTRVRPTEQRNHTVINAFVGNGTTASIKQAHAGIFVESIWSNKSWRESIFSNQL